ncbi:hypothetical protein Tco_0005361 [Tanacetum coccineum]
MVLNSPCFTVKSWLVQDQTVPVQKQTAFGKDKSNPLIVDSLLKTIRLSIHLVVYNEELAIPEQTATEGKLKENQGCRVDTDQVHQNEDLKNRSVWIHPPGLQDAIENRYGGNSATKKTQKNLLKQQYENFVASSTESTSIPQLDLYKDPIQFNPDDLEDMDLR